MSVRMRHTRAHTKNRRSHHGLAEPRLSLCSVCKIYKERHKMCLSCGQYRGRQVVDMTRRDARTSARAKAKEESKS